MGGTDYKWIFEEDHTGEKYSRTTVLGISNPYSSTPDTFFSWEANDSRHLLEITNHSTSGDVLTTYEYEFSQNGRVLKLSIPDTAGETVYNFEKIH
jgi:hypothetical protein